MNKLLEILSPDFVLRNSLYSSLLIGAVVPLVGIYLIIARKTILAMALPQVSTLGVAISVWLATLCGFRVGTEHHEAQFLLLAIAGALVAMTVALVWHSVVEKRLNSPNDAEIGAAYALAAATTLALAASRFIPELGLLEILQGEVLAVPDGLLWCQIIGFSLIIIVLLAIRQSLQFVLFDATLAFTSGLAAAKLSAITTALIAFTIALGGLCAGPLTIFAFLILPPLAFLPLTRHMGHLYIASAVAGLVCALIGFWVSYSLDDLNIPIPSAQIITLSIVWLFARAYSLLKRMLKATPATGNFNA